MSIYKKLELLKSGKLTAVENAKGFLNKIKKEDKKINSFLDIRPELSLARAKYLDDNRKKLKNKRLFGICIAVKAAINVKDYIISCASRTLDNYKGAYNATVIQKLEDEGAIVIGITNCDEFCSGSSGESSAFGACGNPAAPGKIPGGSSSGSAAAVAAGFCDVSLGGDTGGSIRNPASHCGVVGVKPSYGLVSRYGLIDLSMSLDQIGVIGKNVEDTALVLDVIRGRDEKDAISFESEAIKLKKIGKIKVGVVKMKGVEERIQKIIDRKIEEMKKNLGWDVGGAEIKHIELAVQAYYPLVYTEFFSSTRRFDGRKYGKKIEDTCGKEVLRRILGGNEITKAEFKGAYYRKALDVKELIKEELESVLKKFDCLILPTVPMRPWDIGQGAKMKPEDIYAADALTIPANLAEICAISLPAGKIEGIPVGMQVMCGKGEERKMLSIAREIEKLRE